jgi:HD-like signal output (HDOD) protein
VPKKLNGTLDTFSLADLLQWLEINRLSGRVTISRGEERRTIDLKDGAIVFVSSLRPEERLGTYLVSRGILPERVVYELLADSFVTGRSLTRLIFECGILSREELASAVEQLALLVLLDLFHWRDASFVYDPSVATEDILRIQLSLRGQVLALEGARSVDDNARSRSSSTESRKDELSGEGDFSPQAIAHAFFSVIEEAGLDNAPAAVWRDRFSVFGRFSEKVAAALRQPFRPFPLFADTTERCRAALAAGSESEEVVRLAATDPFLTLDLLFLGNALRTSAAGFISTVEEAAAAVGPGALRRLLELLSAEDAPAVSTRERIERALRRAAVSTAVAASHIAATTGEDPGIAWTLALLEPLGTYELLKILRSEEFEPGPFRAAVLDWYRAATGRLLARKVNLPAAFADVLGSSGEVSSRGPVAEQLVFLAKQMVAAEQVGREWTSQDPELADRYAALAVDDRLAERIATDASALRELLGL